MSKPAEPAPETPCLVIDEGKMRANIERMAASAAALGVNLRPHAKTHKMPEVGRKQIEAGAVGLTVAKISEAEVMAAGGIRDLFVAYPLVTAVKIDRALRLVRDGVRLIVGVDSPAGARAISARAQSAGLELEVRLEIDTGMRRTGVPYGEALELAGFVAGLPGVRLTGIYTFRGAILDGKPTKDLAAAGEQEGRLMAELAGRMRSAGLPIRDVSVGSTPTGLYAGAVPGVTEIRPGTYVFHDRMQAAFGVCGLDDCAGRVLVSVVSRPAPDLAVIDGGSKTFATDVQPGTPPLGLVGFGHIVGLDDAVFERMSEEHGMIRLGSSAQSANLQVGDVLEIIPNHICSTLNLHNRVYVREASGSLAERIIAARGMLE
ncbi:alanine racemase [Paenibacillus thermoaerophilus]|uniref:Alanine racemase n=1 Tax=Paenibacillus thermoaerophilus TaxID=1215385 RepID=A0ABW2V2L8_9BACL|nr:alanine racemase [Paenibacillus thermoaerophilus]TMV16067.1 amino acid aldolase [Paenibacillus thermoaerophilus]